MEGWGDGVARGFLGALAFGLFAAAVADWWVGSKTFAAPLLLCGLLLAILCAFYRDISGEVNYTRVKLRFSGPAHVSLLPKPPLPDSEGDGLADERASNEPP